MLFRPLILATLLFQWAAVSVRVQIAVVATNTNNNSALLREEQQGDAAASSATAARVVVTGATDDTITSSGVAVAMDVGERAVKRKLTKKNNIDSHTNLFVGEEGLGDWGCYNPSCVVHSGESKEACNGVRGCTWYPHSASFGGKKPLGYCAGCLGVSCGNHRAVDCSECIQYDRVTHGKEYCCGECKWDPFASVPDRFDPLKKGLCIYDPCPINPDEGLCNAVASDYCMAHGGSGICFDTYRYNDAQTPPCPVNPDEVACNTAAWDYCSKYDYDASSCYCAMKYDRARTPLCPAVQP